MLITLNGESREVPSRITLAGLLVGTTRPGTAVAVNGDVVPRSRHAAVQLADGDRIDVVEAVQGG